MTSAASISLRTLTGHDLSLAAHVAAVAMRDNPLHLAALGPDPAGRVDIMRSAFERFLRAGRRTVLSAWDDDRLVGVAAYAAAGRCQPTAAERLASVPVALHAGRSARPLLAWQRRWAQLDLRRPHAHLGPVAVLPELQGRGIGSRLLGAYTDHLDRAGLAGYLETDKEINVELYERFGFDVVHRTDVIGVTNWFMARPAGASRWIAPSTASDRR